ncbi:MAG: glutathione S-transferase family protein [Novosphingobium sp.]|nr:glutathione S-transferase family protein [Novosphingobium sp.]
MPHDAPATQPVPTITGFSNVPDFAKGLVRDLRIRWAMEETGRPYRTELFDAMAERPEGYRQWQPFGQVPAFDDGTVRMFESGAILLYLGDRDERLLPSDPQMRWQAVSWLIAALNSIEPALMQIVSMDVFHAGKDWARAARAAAAGLAGQRLASLSNALGDREWLAGTFSVADIAMIGVLRNVQHTDMLDAFPALAAYRARGEARPAFAKALADQIAGFADHAENTENENA